VIWLGADERRQEAVVDVDHPLGEFVAQFGRQNLHVARQHYHVGTLFAHQARHFSEGLLLVGRIDGDMEVWNPVPLDHAAQIVMVGNHARNVAIQLAAVPAMQQVGQAMRFTARHQNHALAPLGVGDTPLHGKLAGNRGKGLTEPVEVERKRISADFMAHEEPAALVVGMVVGFRDPAIVGGEKVTDLGNNANAIGAGNHQPESAH